jgi:hypothetical protein
MPKIKTHNANEPVRGSAKIGVPMNAMSQSEASIESPDASGLHAIGCTQVAAKRGIHGLSPCCTLCHGRDGLQKVYIDNEPMSLCCTAITEIMARWPSTIRYAEAK